MSIEGLRSELIANQKQFGDAQRTMQSAGDEVEKIGSIAAAAIDKIAEVQDILNPVEPALAQISANGQTAASAYTEAVAKLFALTGGAANTHAMSAQNYGGIILDVLQGRIDQNLPAELTQVTEHARTVLHGLAIVSKGLHDLHKASVITEDTIALVAGDRPYTRGWPDIAPGGLTPAIQHETTAFMTELL